MAATTIDPDAMRVAIPAVRELIDLLKGAAQAIGRVAVPAGVPAAVRAQVTHGTSAARQELHALARSLDGIPDDLLRRIAAAQVAEAPWRELAGMAPAVFNMYFSSFPQGMSWAAAAGLGLREALTRPGASWPAFLGSTATAHAAANAPSRLPGWVSRFGSGGARAMGVAGAGATAVSNFSNPYLNNRQKVGRTAASVATGAGASVLGAAAAGAAFWSAVPIAGTLGGAAVGLAWGFADSKLGVSNAIGDAAADAAGEVADTAEGIVDGAGKALDAIGL